MGFIVKKTKYEIYSSSAKSKTATIFGNWIAMAFFKAKLQDSIS